VFLGASNGTFLSHKMRSGRGLIVSFFFTFTRRHTLPLDSFTHTHKAGSLLPIGGYWGAQVGLLDPPNIITSSFSIFWYLVWYGVWWYRSSAYGQLGGEYVDWEIGLFSLKSRGDANGERAMAVHEEALLTGYGKS